MDAQWDYQNDELVRLPRKLSNAMSETVRRFVQKHGLEAYYRWHGADLWIVYKEEAASPVRIGGRKTPVLRQRRVVIGVYRGETGIEPDLAFMPDVLLLGQHGRWVPSEEMRRFSCIIVPLSDLPDSPDQFSPKVTSYLESAWQTAEKLVVIDELVGESARSGFKLLP